MQEMAKRAASTVMTRENWDKEDEPEEQGEFQKANEEVLQKRIIRTAKRRAGLLSDSAGSKPSPFSRFPGFGNMDTPTSESPFSFLNQNKSNTSDNSSSKPEQDSGSAKAETEKETDKKSQNLEILKDLNLSCNSWITEHLEKNPYCILTPIFKDYEKHLAQLDLETEPEKNENSFKLPLLNANNETPKTVAVSKETTETKSNDENEKGFDFKPTLQFDGPKNCIPFIGMFQPPKEAVSLSVGSDVQKEGDEEDEEPSEPPKSEFTPVVEEDSFYDKRCKIFFKKDSNFVPKGVGTMFLKPVKNSQNTQLIVRADTSSGNIILNILLTASLPIQKTGTNNVMIVCVPTPDCKPPPIPVLIRVKTGADCDEVIKKLEECKGS